ncbi:MAG TPA: acyl-CoA thioesterase [Candidatus Cloacimonetes bacterium]|nr:thioesterase [Candidatus Cloacimonas sp.]HHZ15308.1 acyl-CoA thioesterase [Candidatus Cloacimonadota bacterium]
MTYSYKKRIYGFECDVYGHMNNASYLNLLEAARAEALIEMGLSISKLREMNLQIFIVGFELKYLKGIDLEDIVEVKTYTTSLSRLRSRWRQEVYNSNGDLCFTAEMDAVFASEGKAKRLPPEAMEILERGM